MSQEQTTINHRLSNTNSEDVSNEVSGYRLVRKPFMCHMCEREFKKMVPVNEEIEVECPQCNQTFTEEILQTNSSRSANSQNSNQGNRNSGPASPILGSTQAPVN